MDVWQWAVVAVVAVSCIGGMSITLSRMFGRAAASPAVLREATAFESARVGAELPAGATAFDTYSYRVPGRLAGRARIVVADGRVSIAGPRVPSGLYQGWIWAQGLLLALVPVALAAAVVRLDWRWLVSAVGLAVVLGLVSCVGAAIGPGFGETEYIQGGRFRAVDFPLAEVHDVKVGKGWSDGGIDVVLLPVRAAIDKLAEGRAVSFFAPDENGRDVRYALHMSSDSDAVKLAGALRKSPKEGLR